MAAANLDRMEDAIRKKMESMTGFGDKTTQAFKLSMHFKQFDTDKSGKLNKDEFKAALVSLNFVGDQKGLEALFDRYDVDDSGTLTFVEFVEEVIGLKPNPKGDPYSRSVLERVRARVAERGGLNGIRTLGVLFRIMDDNGSNSLSYEEFEKGIKDINVDVTDKEFTQLCKIFDKDGDGQISFDEFLRGIRGKMSRARQHFVFLAFETLDKDKSGQVTLDELAKIYDTSKHPEVIKGEKTPEEVVKEFASMWDDSTAPDGIVTMDEFLNYYKDVSASIDSDEYFELMMRNAWHISGGEGAAANTSCIRCCVTHTDNSQEIVEVQDDIGVSRSDMEEIERRLIAQGVKNIKDRKSVV